MFKRHPEKIELALRAFLRANGLETPLLQRRLIAAWPEIAGQTVARHTKDVAIRNQTLVVQLDAPALRSDLTMRTTELIRQLNAHVGANIISLIRFM